MDQSMSVSFVRAQFESMAKSAAAAEDALDEVADGADAAVGDAVASASSMRPLTRMARPISMGRRNPSLITSSSQTNTSVFVGHPCTPQLKCRK
mmetsp:Transcript_26033/g.57866  ORF Transcript_26033/g.57866 Transcript_26033/m.57866 type:complete len:94 (-) Transcript_26033:509-790(-)